MDPCDKHPENPAEIAIHNMLAAPENAADAAVTDEFQAADETPPTPLSGKGAAGGGGDPVADDDARLIMDAVFAASSSMSVAATPTGRSSGGVGGDDNTAPIAPAVPVVSTASLGALASVAKHGKAPAYVLELARHVGGTYSLGLWVARHLSAEVYGVKSPNTLEAKIRDLNGFIAWFVAENGHDDMRQWLPRDTSAYLAALGGNGLAPTTINRVFATIRRFAKWAHDEPGQVFALGGLPMRGIQALAVDEADCKKFDRRDVMRLMKAADMLVHIYDSEATDAKARKNARPRRNRAIQALLYYTGLRVSELIRLKMTQLQGSHLVNVTRKGKARSRKIFLAAECRRLLDDYLKTERAADDPKGVAEPLLLSTAGKGADLYMRRNRINRVLKQIAEHAKAARPELGEVSAHPHRYRHTFGSEHRDKFGSDGETAAALGHTSLQYVARYTRRSDAERDEMIEEMFGN